MQSVENNKKEKKFVSLVVYLHDVAPYLPYFLDTVLPVFEANFEQFEMVCVNDACADDTIEVLKEYIEKKQVNVMVNVVHMSFFQGLESAMNAGRDIAIGDFVYEFDDIFVDYEPELIMEVYRELLNGSDIVAASSKGKLRLTSKFFYFLYNKTSRGNGKIGPETFRIVSRRAINRIKSMGQHIPYRKAVYSNCGLKTATISYESKDVNARVKNKTVASERTSLALDSFIYFTNALERVSAVLCGIFLLVIVGVGIYIISEIAALICTDAGNAALGKTLQFLSTALILYMSLPMFSQLLSLIESILGEL